LNKIDNYKKFTSFEFLKIFEILDKINDNNYSDSLFIIKKKIKKKENLTNYEYSILKNIIIIFLQNQDNSVNYKNEKNKYPLDLDSFKHKSEII
jgi:hypothetical protein